jgi:RNA polymerase sigma factor (sigma-70 family)
VADAEPSTALAQLRKLLAAVRDSRLPDNQLLARFVAERDEAAFAALVKRHGPMVLGVCQSVLRHAQDAEDVCQATFLILAQKAGSIRKKNSVASWLHGVAHRLAWKLETSRRRLPKPVVSDRMAANPMDELSWREVREIVHEELARLPENYRQPLILCYLEGQTQEQAARQLGWTAGMLKGMLTRGRDVLRQRLTQRGLAMAVPLFAGVLASGTASAVLTKTTAHAAVMLVTGKTLGEGITAQAAALAKGGINAMAMTKLKVAAMVLAMGLLAAGGGMAAYRVGEGEQAIVRPKAEPEMPPALEARHAAKPNEQARRDLFGDPLPAGAVARIGTTRFLQGYGSVLFPLEYTADGKQLISIEAGKAVVFRDAATGKELQRIAAEGQCFFTFALSPDGKMVATVSGTYPSIRVWDVASCKEIHQISYETIITPQEVESPASAFFTPDGKTLAVSKRDGIIRLWDVAAWREKPPLPRGGGALQVPHVGVPIYHFLPGGKTLISASKGNGYNGITWWDIRTGKAIRRLDVQPGSQYGWAMAVSPDGKRLAAVVKPGLLLLWNTATGEEISRIALAGLKDRDDFCLCFSPDSQTLAYAANPGLTNASRASPETVFFAASTGKETHRWRSAGNVAFMVFSPDGSTLAQSRRTVIDCLDVKTGKPVSKVQRLSEYVLSVDFALNDKALVACCRDGVVSSWDPLTGKQMTPFWAPPIDVEGPSMLYASRFTPDGTRAAAWDANRKLHVWEPATGKVLCQMEAEEVNDYPVFSRDGKVFAMAFKDGNTCFWDATNGNLLSALPFMRCISKVFSPDGRILATAAAQPTAAVPPIDRAIHLWESPSGKKIKQLVWQGGSQAWALAFSPDGKRLVSAHNDLPTLSGKPGNKALSWRVWDLATGEQLRHFEGTDAAVGSILAISPDGKTLATQTSDPANRLDLASDSVKLVELATGNERAQFKGHTGSVYSLSFSLDSRLLASGGGDHTALVWDVTGISPGGKLVPRDAPPEEIERLWSDLASSDGVKAYRAIWTLVAAVRQSVPFLAERLRPAVAADEQRVARLISELDSEQFNFPEQLQILRALEVLENVGTAEARQVLESLAKGTAGAMQTKEANASLDRLANTVKGEH